MITVPTYLAAVIGCAVGAAAIILRHRYKIKSYEILGQQILQRAEIDSEAIRRENELAMRHAELAHRKQLESERQQEARAMQKEQDKLQEREDKLETRNSLIDKKLQELIKRETCLEAANESLKKKELLVEQQQKDWQDNLQKLAGLSEKEAKEQYLKVVSESVQRDAAAITRRTMEEAEEEAEQRATRIIATAINRMAVSQVSEITVSAVTLPNEEIKSRIVGREGRNIRALEQATGVNFILDESPDTVVISGFDPVRKQVAKTALSDLIAGGRIHPTRIEEAVEKANESLDKQILQAGEDAALRIGALDLHIELKRLLGQLSLRYSCGQNLLKHSLEVAYLLGMMAEELGLDSRLARRIGLLHDIGKVAMHEMQGTHALIGHALALKYGESEEVANGIGCHHREMPPITVEGSLCEAADAISAARPGARIEAVAEYVKRLKKLEELAFEFPAVDKAYALQAGREIRVILFPEMIDDQGAVNLSRDLSQAIQQKMRYSGKIKVTVIREKRITCYG